jgi:hypothetical protein
VLHRVTDSIENQIEEYEKIKTGKYINREWICDDCFGVEHKEKEYVSSDINQSDNSNNNQCDNIGTASKSDVSPNTPTADESKV